MVFTVCPKERYGLQSHFSIDYFSTFKEVDRWEYIWQNTDITCSQHKYSKQLLLQPVSEEPFSSTMNMLQIPNALFLSTYSPVFVWGVLLIPLFSTTFLSFSLGKDQILQINVDRRFAPNNDASGTNSLNRDDVSDIYRYNVEHYVMYHVLYLLLLNVNVWYKFGRETHTTRIVYNSRHHSVFSTWISSFLTIRNSISDHIFYLLGS